MRMTALSTLALLGTFLLASQNSAQTRAWIVDDNPTPAPDFQTLQAAVDAAAEGDTILVEAGSYPGFTITGKAVRVLAVAPGTVIIEEPVPTSVSVQGTALGQDVVLRGLTLDAELRLEQCAGSVLVEECTLEEGVDVDQSSAGVLARCEVSGGIDALDSVLAIYDTVSAGAVYEGAGLRLTNSEGFSSGGLFEGGPGLWGSPSPFSLFCDGGPGGPGIQLSNSTWRHTSSLFAGGHGGAPGYSEMPGVTCSWGPTGTPVSGSGLLDLGGPAHSLEFSSPAAEQSKATLIARGAPGEHAFVLLSVNTISQWFPPWSGQLVSGPPWITIFAGVLPPDGVQELQFTIGELAPAAEAIGATAQGLFVHPSTLGPNFVGSATSVVLIDRFLALDDCDADGEYDSVQLGAGAPDCNGNGQLDSCDLAQGLEADCNANDVPDSCELALGTGQDCNFNGIPDECDIASGLSLDLDLDGVPDECSIKVVPTQYSTIQGAINACQDGDTVLVLDGTYTGYSNESFDLDEKAITVRSQNGPAACIIDANGIGSPVRIDHAPPGAAVIGFTFRDYAMLTGPVLHAHNSRALVEDCVFEQNDMGTQIQIHGDSAGAGICKPVIRACRFLDNEISINALGGCAIEITGSVANPLIDACEFRGNLVSENGDALGGGVSVGSSASARLRNCLFVENEVISWSTPSPQSKGGGIYVSSSASVGLSGCTFAANRANLGSALHLAGGSAFVTNSIFWSAQDQHGLPASSIYLEGAAVLTLDHTTLEGGLAGGVSLGAGTPVVNLGPGLLSADPGFVAPLAGDYHLGAGSPCVDAGDPGFTPLPGELDIDGDPRLLGAWVDMGADERQP
ncbi:MAG: right-handed parallel beta-helix repeat-containing protein [Planctomycetota bacterium]|nr:right-handed parallel beta-helix repeat-containing protein [Planctomycetota bacterium]